MSPKLAPASPASVHVNTLITPQLITALSPRLMRYALRSTRVAADAEDAVQETWAAALHERATFEGRSSLSTWLTAVLRRRLATNYRKARNEQPLDQDAAETALSAETALDVRAAMHFLAPELEQLAPLERQAFRLCTLEELTRDEAAARMRVTRAHLRVLLHRARARLAQRLEKQGFERGETAQARSHRHVPCVARVETRRERTPCTTPRTTSPSTSARR